MFFNEMPVNVIIFFIISGLTQIFWFIPVIKRWSNIWYYIGIGGTGDPNYSMDHRYTRKGIGSE